MTIVTKPYTANTDAKDAAYYNKSDITLAEKGLAAENSRILFVNDGSRDAPADRPGIYPVPDLCGE